MAVEEVDLEKYKNLNKLFQDYKNLIFKEIEEDKIRKGEENE